MYIALIEKEPYIINFKYIALIFNIVAFIFCMTVCFQTLKPNIVYL